MNKFLASASMAGAIALLPTAGCVADRSPAEISFEATTRQLDMGGDYFFYLQLEGISGEINSAVDEIAGVIPPGAETADVEKWIGMIHYGIDMVGIDQLRGIGLSSRQLCAKKPLYRIRQFEYTGKEKPKGFLFDLAGRENRPFTMRKWIPANARLAVGGFLNLGASYRSLAAGLNAAPYEEMKAVPAKLDAASESVFGKTAAELLDSVSGEFFLLATTADDGAGALMLVIPDRGGILGAQLLREYAPMLTRVEGKENTFALPAVVPLPGFQPQVTFGGDRITLVSTPAILDATAKAAAGNGAAEDPELAAYFADMPASGLNYGYVNIDQTLTDSLVMLGENSGAGPELGVMLRAFFDALGEPVCYQVGTRAADGYASVSRANFSLSDFQLKMPIRVYGAIIATALQESIGRAPSAMPSAAACIANQKQLMLGLMMYGLDNGDSFPAGSGAEGLKLLREKDYISDPAVFVCPEDGNRTPAADSGALTEANCSYIYFGGLKLGEIKNPAQYPVIFDKPGVHEDGELHVGFADGHVATYSIGEYTSPEQVILMLNEEMEYPKPVFDDLMKRAKEAVAK